MTRSTLPSVTVVMAAYNAEKYLADAIESILNQTFSDFEFVIVDDASTDKTSTIVSDFAKSDSRIRVFRNKSNLERSASRNFAIREARSNLIAVMDADDVSLPNRLALQVAFMETNPEILLSSGAMEFYETKVLCPEPETNESIRAWMLLACPFCHPASIFRRQPVMALGGYNETMVPAEDYDLWARLAALPGWKFANLKDVLLRYRTHPESDRKAYLARQKEKTFEISKAQLIAFGMPESDIDLETHAALVGVILPEPLSRNRIESWVEKLIQFNSEKKLFTPSIFNKVCHERMHVASVPAGWVPLWLKLYLPSKIKKLLRRLVFMISQ
jgi:hypothetical protein